MRRLNACATALALLLSAPATQAVVPGDSHELTSTGYLADHAAREVAGWAGRSDRTAVAASAGDSMELTSTGYLEAWRPRPRGATTPAAAEPMPIAGGHSLENTSTEYLRGCMAELPHERAVAVTTR